MKKDRTIWLIIPFIAIVMWWWWGNVGPQPEPDHYEGPASSQGPERIDPDSGLPWVNEAGLPSDAKNTLELIKTGGPFPYPPDDQVFGNFEGILPKEAKGYYREYTVETPGSDDRGPRRIVVGSGGEYYWTTDHYQSFERIENP